MSDIQTEQRFEGKSYDEILDELKNLKRKVGYLYIPALCVAYKREHLTMENEEIKERVMTDCLEIGLWTEGTIYVYFPKWINREYPLNRKKFEETLNTSKEVERQKNLDLLSKTIHQIPEPPKITEPEPEEPSHVEVDEGPTEPQERYVPTPMEMYEGAIHGFDKSWQYLTNKKHIIPAGGAQDVLLTHLKPSDKLRLRMFKGLDKQRAIYFHNMLVSMEMLIKRSLDMWDELKKEDTAKEIQQ